LPDQQRWKDYVNAFRAVRDFIALPAVCFAIHVLTGNGAMGGG
jgi:hypothetical protein